MVALPILDFSSSFNIDIVDQRRPFAEIIGMDLGTALGACKTMREGFSNQPGDIPAPTVLSEEVFLGIEI